MSAEPPIKCAALLCDSAQELGGKLYVLGGGWSRIWAAGPINMALAVKFVVPWHLANHRLPLRIELLTEDGQAVTAANGGPLRVEGQLEVGRPPGLRPGSGLDSALAVPLYGLALGPGFYRWEIRLADHLLESLAFEVISTAPPQPKLE